MHRFAAFERVVSSKIDEWTGERKQIFQSAAGVGKGFLVGAKVANPMLVVGVVAEGASEAFARGARSNMQDRADVEVMNTTISYRADALAAASIRLAGGDEIVLFDRPRKPSFVVSDVDADGMGRVSAIVKYLKDTVP